MIKAINVSPLNTTSELFAKCKYCHCQVPFFSIGVFNVK